MRSPSPRLWAGLATFLGLIVIVATHDDYGVTWDDSVNARYGEKVLDYFRSGFTDRGANEISNLRFYGPAFDAVAALAHRLLPGDPYEIRHLLAALSGLLTVWGVVRVGGLFEIPGVGPLAGLLLVLMPRFYGHAFINTKDVPFACLLTWSIFALIRLVERPGRRSAAVCGLVFGGALAVRPGGLLILLALFCWVAGFARLRRTLTLSARQAACVWLIAWLTMVAFWPAAHESPILHPLRSVAYSAAFPLTLDVLFAGEVFRSDALPRDYLIRSLIITTPVVTLALSALGLIFLTAARGRRSGPAASAGLAVSAWLLLPLLLAAVVRPNVYDGLRHILFVLPALSLMGGLGAACLILRVGRWRTVAGPALVLLCCLPVRDLIRLHPYQMTYFNSIVGGLRHAADEYETDYWATSYKESVEWINAQAAARPGEVSILVAASSFSEACARTYLAPGIRMETTFEREVPGALPEGFDYYLATTRYGLDQCYPDSPIVHEVGREGAVFAVIRGRPADP